jgi:hypothetical protein
VTPDDLVYAAYARCRCGAGLAYSKFDPRRHSGAWDCSAVLLGTVNEGERHDKPLPFAGGEITSELQPSAQGATTRD